MVEPFLDLWVLLNKLCGLWVQELADVSWVGTSHICGRRFNKTHQSLEASFSNVLYMPLSLHEKLVKY